MFLNILCIFVKGYKKEINYSSMVRLEELLKKSLAKGNVEKSMADHIWRDTIMLRPPASNKVHTIDREHC